MIFIPPFSSGSPDPSTPLPPCLQDYPAAIIHYRWRGHKPNEEPDVPLHWPTPVHDVAFAYSWLSANLCQTYRSAYVVGSYLGASLAASLALTQSSSPESFLSVHGFVAYNGIYNWTMFLPDHPLHKGIFHYRKYRNDKTKTAVGMVTEEEGIFTQLKHQMPALFSKPANLFDPFASPCLFFHLPGMHVPDDFTNPISSYLELPASPDLPEWEDAVQFFIKIGQKEKYVDPQASRDELLASATIRSKLTQQPNLGYLEFPSGGGSFLPSALLLYDRPRQTQQKQELSTTSTHNFKMQAGELGWHMRRQLKMSMSPWWEEGKVRLDEVEPTAIQVEEKNIGLGLSEEGNEMVREWLKEVGRGMEEEEEEEEEGAEPWWYKY